MIDNNSTAYREQAPQSRASEKSPRLFSFNFAGTGWLDANISELLGSYTLGSSILPVGFEGDRLGFRRGAHIETNLTLSSEQSRTLLSRTSCYLKLAYLIDSCDSEFLSPDVADNFALGIKKIVQDYGARAVSIARQILNQRGNKFLIREFLHALGEVRSPDSVTERQWILLEMLEHKDAGARMAAASALGNLGDRAGLRALERRLSRETNRFVAQMISAHLRCRLGHVDPAED